jgi:hypothetical protein
MYKETKDGAVEKTRTSTSCDTRPSNVRVYHSTTTAFKDENYEGFLFLVQLQPAVKA